MGKGKKLFKYYLLALFIPLVIWLAIIIICASMMMVSAFDTTGSLIFWTSLFFIIYLAVFIIMVPYTYLSYKWFFNVAWKDSLITLDTQFWPSVRFMSGQILLTIITIGIYWPAMKIKLWRYFATRTVMLSDGKETGRFGFDGKTGKGFLLLWGQSLLCIITLGIYLPWAIANCLRYFINATFIEDQQKMINS